MYIYRNGPCCCFRLFKNPPCFAYLRNMPSVTKMFLRPWVSLERGCKMIPFFVICLS